MKGKKYHKRRLFLPVCGAALLLTGCGGGQRELAVIDRTPYEKLSYETVQVQGGAVSYTRRRGHEAVLELGWRLLL
ncbi:MAG: hypothetical protein K2O73_11355, partial [Lachnospiraceae bacterium]|nr:hypothetical protein [Lachnospiraceae bacterium]